MVKKFQKKNRYVIYAQTLTNNLAVITKKVVGMAKQCFWPEQNFLLSNVLQLVPKNLVPRIKHRLYKYVIINSNLFQFALFSFLSKSRFLCLFWQMGSNIEHL